MKDFGQEGLYSYLGFGDDNSDEKKLEEPPIVGKFNAGLLCIANSDIAGIRLVITSAAQGEMFGVTALDVEAAF